MLTATVLRANSLLVVISVDDHEPGHVHVFGDGQAKTNLRTSDGRPELVWTEGMTRGEVRRAMRIVVGAAACLMGGHPWPN
jgi:Domain of unknown function (DUF4160)